MTQASRASLAAALLALLAGCASDPPAPAEQLQPAVSNPFASVLADDRSGLEVQWWTVTDQGDAIAKALAPFADAPLPISADIEANWRRNGFRMVAIPADQLGPLISALPIEDKVNRIWLGQTPGWAIAAPGAPWRGARSLLIDGETIQLNAGQLRLLVRAWVSPTEGAPTMRTDLAVQYLSAGADNRTPTLEQQTEIRRPDTLGMIFRTLTAAMELEDGTLYCILSEDPGAEWSAIAEEPAEDAETEAVPTLPVRAPSPFDDPIATDDGAALGPQPPGIPLLADALLSRVELLPTRRQARSIVILAPRVPSSFRLAPVSAE